MQQREENMELGKHWKYNTMTFSRDMRGKVTALARHGYLGNGLEIDKSGELNGPGCIDEIPYGNVGTARRFSLRTA